MGCGTIPNSHANLLRSEHLVTCAAKVMLTLTSSSALNNANTLQPKCSRETLQLLENKGPRAVPTKQRARAGAGRSLLIVPRVSPHSESHCGSVATPGSRKDLEPSLRAQWSRSCPSLRAFSRNSSSSLGSPGPGRGIQQLLLLPGWHGVRSGTQKPRFSPCSCCG